mmetsp:Transcript_4188/g.8077  ORF Transcript_4188/g.8077 Transcript_4188/m.8077 type:complete len:131 (-) Transcript_4188:986-1378(-)
MGQWASDLREHIICTQNLWLEFKSTTQNKYTTLYNSGRWLQSHHLKSFKTVETARWKYKDKIEKLKHDVRLKAMGIKSLKDCHLMEKKKINKEDKQIVSKLKTENNKLTNNKYKKQKKQGESSGGSKKQQ